jgi:hypothetical protein
MRNIVPRSISYCTRKLKNKFNDIYKRKNYIEMREGMGQRRLTVTEKAWRVGHANMTFLITFERRRNIG